MVIDITAECVSSPELCEYLVVRTDSVSGGLYVPCAKWGAVHTLVGCLTSAGAKNTHIWLELVYHCRLLWRRSKVSARTK